MWGSEPTQAKMSASVAAITSRAPACMVAGPG